MPRIQGLDLDCDNPESVKLSAKRPNVEAALRFADAGSRRTTGGLLAARLTLFLMCSAPSLPAQVPPASPAPRPASHQTAQPRRAASDKGSANAAAPSASTIQFENRIEQSKIKFKLKNSISPQRYTFETMTGGVALFDYNNDGLLDIFFTNGASIPSLEKSDDSYSNRLFRNNGDGTFTDVTEKAGLAGRRLFHGSGRR